MTLLTAMAAVALQTPYAIREDCAGMHGPIGRGVCYGYIQAVVDSGHKSSDGCLAIALRGDETLEELAAMVVEFTGKHPEMKLDAFTAVWLSLATKRPANGQGPGCRS